MDTILKESVISAKAKKVILTYAVGFILLGLLSFVRHLSLYNRNSNKYYDYYYGTIGHYNDFWAIPFVYVAIICLFIGLLCLLFFLMLKKTQIIITDKRVTGITHFGRKVDLPLDNISAVGSSWLKGVQVATSSGKISFLFIEKSDEVYELLRQLLIERQEKSQKIAPSISNADELIKYKELLDNGTITKEEFEVLKQQFFNR